MENDCAPSQKRPEAPSPRAFFAEFGQALTPEPDFFPTVGGFQPGDGSWPSHRSNRSPKLSRHGQMWKTPIRIHSSSRRSPMRMIPAIRGPSQYPRIFRLRCDGWTNQHHGANTAPLMSRASECIGVARSSGLFWPYRPHKPTSPRRRRPQGKYKRIWLRLVNRALSADVGEINWIECRRRGLCESWSHPAGSVKPGANPGSHFQSGLNSNGLFPDCRACRRR